MRSIRLHHCHHPAEFKLRFQRKERELLQVLKDERRLRDVRKPFFRSSLKVEKLKYLGDNAESISRSPHSESEIVFPI